MLVVAGPGWRDESVTARSRLDGGLCVSLLVEEDASG